MHIHDEVLSAARRLCRERASWTFAPDEVVRALPHLNESSVRTHIVSRCCVNAPKNHQHKWDYFRRLGRATYEILPEYRRDRTKGTKAKQAVAQSRIAETATQYGKAVGQSPRGTIHAVVSREGGWYVAECLEVAVVTQGRTMDEVISNLREAVELHIENEDRTLLGLAQSLALSVTYETPVRDAG